MSAHSCKKIKCKPTTFGNGHSDPTSAYNQFKAAIKQEFEHVKPMQGKLAVSALLYLTQPRSSRSDLDNYAKAIVDALHESKVFLDESQIFKLVLTKTEVSRPDEEGVKISVTELQQNGN